METLIQASKRSHHLSSIFLLLGMGGLLGLTGYLIMGITGMILAASIGVGLALFGPRISTRMSMRATGSRRLHPAEAPELFRMMEYLAGKAHLPALPALYMQPGPILNAFTVGTRQNPAIAVSQGLLQSLNRRQLYAVLAHEVSHIQNNDVAVMSTAAQFRVLTENLSFMGKILLLLSLPAFLFGGYTIPWAALVLLLLSPGLSLMLQLALSRTREFNADLGAVRLTGDHEGLASALLHLDGRSKSMMARLFGTGKEPVGPEWLRTHPHNNERIRRLRALATAPQPSSNHKPAEVIDVSRKRARQVRFIPVAQHKHHPRPKTGWADDFLNEAG